MTKIIVLIFLFFAPGIFVSQNSLDEILEFYKKDKKKNKRNVQKVKTNRFIETEQNTKHTNTMQIICIPHFCSYVPSWSERLRC